MSINMRDTRTIYEDDYYILSGILHSKKFQNALNVFKEKVNKTGSPLPNEGFKTARLYQGWAHKLLEAGIDSETFLDNQLDNFNVKNRRDEIKLGLKFAIFFGKKNPPIKGTLSYSVTSNLENDSIEAIIQLKAWSTKEDFEEVWKEIDEQRRKLPNFQDTKNKPWETFERDFKVYELFLQVKKDIESGIYKSPNEKSPYRQIAYYPEFEALTEKFGEDFEFNLRNIISRCEKDFKNLNIL